MSRGEKLQEALEPRRAEIGRAGPGDLNAVLALLAECSLPREGVAGHFAHFLVARARDTVVGSIGMEPYGPSALLRSLAVASAHRGRGLGRALTDRVITEARAQGVRRLFLLTETAPEFFEALGFRRITRQDADPAVTTSEEFRTVCCESAVCMRLDL